MITKLSKIDPKAVEAEIAEMDVDWDLLMADVSETIAPPKMVVGLICNYCYDCDEDTKMEETPAICTECYVSQVCSFSNNCA